MIGVMFEKGISVVRNPSRARGYYERAARSGDAYGEYSLGRAYLTGLGGNKSRPKAMTLIRRAAEKGLVGAMFLLGNEERRSRRGDKARAVHWIERAATAGYVPAQSLFGHLLAEGEGVTKDAEKALEWTRKAAEKGDVGAQNRLGSFYLTGQGTASDAKQAAVWFTKAADQGHIGSQTELGKLYAEGNGVAKRPHEALKWLRRAAQRGDARALYELGRMHEKGAGVKASENRARLYFRMAAKKGSVAARDKLAEMDVAKAAARPPVDVDGPVLLSATAVILVHNHPSGDPTPSRADIDMTRRIVEAAKNLGITVHDHIVIGGNREVSFRHKNLM